jgi:shikimate dehydrogenase
MTTRRACVIGHPVAHSRSPAIHRYWLDEYKIDGDYVREDVAPEKLASFLETLEERGYVGANVTVPHKAAAFSALDYADSVAAALKVTNTIWLEQGRLHGTNTDVYGFLSHLEESLHDWAIQAEQAVVLGAGGAARAVIYALLERNISRIIVVNRTASRAEALAVEFNGRMTTATFDELPAWLKDADLLVNTTSLGMTGQPALEIDLDHLNATAAVYDIVYVPLEAPLLAAARARGLRTVDGLGMLLHQAVPAFERFFGVRPAVTPGLREAVLADLAKARAA